MMKNKAIGFYFTLIAAILSIVSLVLYGGVMYKLPVVYAFCVLPVVLVVVAVALSFAGKSVPVFQYLPVVNAALAACAAIWAVYLMVNQIGYVIAALDDKSTIMGLIYFEAVTLLSMLLNIIGAFLRQDK